MGPLAILARATQRAEDSAEDRRVKNAVFPAGVCLAVASLGFIHPSLPLDGLHAVGALLSVAVIWAAVLLLFTPLRTVVVIESALTGLFVAALIGDWGRSAELLFRIWPELLTVADLWFTAGSGVAPTAIVAVLMMWLALERAEAAARFGLYDPPSWADGKVDACDCASPPCALGTGVAVSDFIHGAIVIALNQYWKRQFLGCGGAGPARERGGDQAAELAEELVEHIGQANLAAAAYALETKGAVLPGRLEAAFERLLATVEEYQRYLPQACLVLPDSEDEYEYSEDPSRSGSTPAAPPAHFGRFSLPTSTLLSDDTEGEGALASHPGSVCSLHRVHSTLNQDPDVSVPIRQEAPSGDSVTIVFTDVEGSTELWDKFPVGMQRALAAHNQVLRHGCAEFRGYEVKVIGDSFMIAFSSPALAVSFCLHVQEQLVDAQWPPELLTLPRCAPVPMPGGGLLWGGLRVRAGVHCGPTRREDNPVTGRADYFGRAVNTAARTESAAMVGGMVAVTEPAWQRASQEAAPGALAGVNAIDLGAPEMKGVADPPRIYALFQKRLANRAGEVLRAREGRLKSQESPGGQETFRQTSTEAVALQQAHTERVLRPRGTRLHYSVATLAAVHGSFRELHHAPDAAAVLGEFVSSVDAAVDRTGGSLVIVMDSGCLTAWNAAGRPCPQHTTQAMRAAAALRQSQRPDLYLGTASGPVVHGNVGTAKRRFVLVQGQAMELSGRVGRAAVRLRAFALVASTGNEPCAADDPSIRPLSRAVDVWPLTGGRPIVVYEIDFVALGADLGTWGAQLHGGASAHGDAWGSEEWVTQLIRAHGARVGSAAKEEAVAALRRIASVTACPSCKRNSVRPSLPCSCASSRAASVLCNSALHGASERSPTVASTVHSSDQRYADLCDMSGSVNVDDQHVLVSIIDLAAIGTHLTVCPISWNCVIPAHPTPQWLGMGDRARRSSQRRSETQFGAETEIQRVQSIDAWSDSTDLRRRRSNSWNRRRSNSWNSRVGGRGGSMRARFQRSGLPAAQPTSPVPMVRAEIPELEVLPQLTQLTMSTTAST
eukprot:TRINITY_DN17919_c1_g3_i1.p1 TRINITY_DN17919_c1_g3~~TRINITY_DN17919_c1_g3_i1.p1  ORF type:complete len:1060 (+),score=230.22 TRINITY_DN17919_c1_g3_i1:89-3268(+)